jgi:MoxR-like ATPase
MEERQVSADGVTHRLGRPFLVLATQNPVESEGTYPLPEAQLDRFLLRLAVGYPSEADEVALLRLRVDRGTQQAQAAGPGVPAPAAGTGERRLRPLLNGAAVVALQQAVERVQVSDDVLRYVVALVTASRDDERTEVGASPRAAVALTQAARAWAALRGRGFVVPDDVKRLATPALAHRLVLRPEAWVRGATGVAVVTDLLGRVPTPAALTETDRRAAAAEPPTALR